MRRATTLVLALACVAVVPRAGRAETELVRRGYVLSRSQLLPADDTALLNPMLEVEALQTFLEANLDLTLRTSKLTLRSDTSALYRVAPSGCRDGSDLPGCLVINELYLTTDAGDHIAMTVGRVRPSWGAAMSFHPVEPMNPQPDPTDPTFQRLGAWTAMLELSTERHIATVAWFPAVSHSALGTPDDLAPGLLGGRYGWRPEGFDVSGVGFIDLETGLPMTGLAGSTVLGETSFEVHGEVLVHQRREIETGTLKEGTCAVKSLGIPHRKEWDFSGIAGARWDRGDGTLVNLEYMHNGDGMETNDFNAVLATAEQLTQQCPDGRIEPGDASEDGRPQQLSSTFLRRNYAILSFVRPTFADEGWLSNLGANATAFVGLDDLSGVVSARVVYTLFESVILRLGGLTLFGGDRTQYGVLPFRGIVMLDLQALY